MSIRLLLAITCIAYLPFASALTYKDKLVLEGSAYRAASFFHYVSLEEGSRESYEEMEERLRMMDSELSSLSSSNLNDIKVTWKEMKTVARKNEINQLGYTKPHTISDLNTSKAALIQLLNDRASDEVLSDNLRALKLATDMRRLEMVYAEGAASLLGFPYNDLDKQAIAFGEELRALSKRTDLYSPEDIKTIKAALRAWDYMEKALIQYNEMNIPELVKRMSAVIVRKLQEVDNS